MGRHPVYWFDDGSVIVKLGTSDDTVVLFRIHDRLLRRHSRRVLEPTESEDGQWDVPIVTIPVALGVQVEDFTALLAHLYHDTPLLVDTPFQHVAAVLRASSPDQLDVPPVHRLARSCFIAMFPSGPYPFVQSIGPELLEEALRLAVRYDITSIQKGIYYSLVTATDFDSDPLDSDAAEIPSSEANATGARASSVGSLTPTDLARCRQLMQGIVTHFTPVLFEPAVSSHMACSNLLGDKWYPLVVQSAIMAAGDSVYRPLEVLEGIKRIDWIAEGLCAACVREKREDWTNAQKEVWEKMDGWLELDVPTPAA